MLVELVDRVLPKRVVKPAQRNVHTLAEFTERSWLRSMYRGEGLGQIRLLSMLLRRIETLNPFIEKDDYTNHLSPRYTQVEGYWTQQTSERLQNSDARNKYSLV